jgi:enoyl-CoA hydratase
VTGRSNAVIEIEREGEVALLYLNRAKVNALDPALVSELLAKWRELDADPATGAVVLASRREGVFSAGFDLKALHDLQRDRFAVFIQTFASLYYAIFAGAVPVVAAVGGHAIAGGAILALACDRRIFSRGEGRFGVTEVDLALPLPPGVLQLLRAAAGEGPTVEAALFGRLYTPEEARASGYADRLVETGDALTEALREAHVLAAKPREALRTIRRELRSPWSRRVAEADAGVGEAFAHWWFSKEATARREALLAKLAVRH